LHWEFGKPLVVSARHIDLAPRSKDHYPTPPLPRCPSRRYNRDFREHTVADPRWFFRNDDEWNTIVQRLKLTACPHCHAVGTLVCHGYLRGFDGDSGQRKSHPSPANLLL
jgi:hypothetical protein